MIKWILIELLFFSCVLDICTSRLAIDVRCLIFLVQTPHSIVPTDDDDKLDYDLFSSFRL